MKVQKLVACVSESVNKCPEGFFPQGEAFDLIAERVEMADVHMLNTRYKYVPRDNYSVKTEVV